MAVLFIGTIPPPISGQALAYYYSYIGYEKNKILINKNKGAEKGGFIRFLYYMFFILQFIYYCLFKNVNVIYSTAFGSLGGSIIDIIVFNIAKMLNIQIIVHFHSSNFRKIVQEDAKSFHKFIVINTYKKIDKAIVLCNSMKEQINFLIEDKKIIIISNFYDPILEEISLEDIETKISSPIVFGYVSNLVYSKGIIHLLEAFEELNEYLKSNSNEKQVELWIAGKIMSDEYMSDTELKMNLEFYLKKHPNIKYFKIIIDNQKKDFLKKVHVFVLPTFYRHEAQPLSLFEGMRAGCVIITTDYKYLPDFINKENGFLIPIKSKEAIRDKLIYLIENPAIIKEFGINNFNISKKNYSVKTYQTLVNSTIDFKS